MIVATSKTKSTSARELHMCETTRWSAMNLMYWHIRSAFILMSLTGSAFRNTMLTQAALQERKISIPDIHSPNNDVLNGLRVGMTLQVAEEEAGKVGVHTLIMADKFIWQGKSRHEPSLLHPEDGHEGAGEEDALNSECWLLVQDPPESSLRLALYARNCFDGVKEILTLRWVLDVPLDEKRVGLGVDVLHHNLEPIDPWTSFKKCLSKFLLTIPSEAVKRGHGRWSVIHYRSCGCSGRGDPLKNPLLMILSEPVGKARTWEMKWCSLSFMRLFQSWRSFAGSISAIQKDASAFSYICQI